MATITNRTDSNLLAYPRLRVAAGVIRPVDVRAVEVEAAYEEARRVADERAALVEAFVAARGDWTGELRVLAKARRFDDAHPSRDPLYDELHADQLYGQQYPEAA